MKCSGRNRKTEDVTEVSLGRRAVALDGGAPVIRRGHLLTGQGCSTHVHGAGGGAPVARPGPPIDGARLQ